MADIDEVLRVFTTANFDASLTELVPFLGSRSSDEAVEHFRDAARNEATRYVRAGSELPVEAQMAESCVVARDCLRRWDSLTIRPLPTGPVVGLNRFRDLVRDIKDPIRGLDGYLTIPGCTLAVRKPLEEFQADIDLIARGYEE